MTRFESTVDCLVLRSARAGVGPGYTLEAAAVRLGDEQHRSRDLVFPCDVSGPSATGFRAT